jgi:transcriptional regulator with XRE-family HTH domain
VKPAQLRTRFGQVIRRRRLTAQVGQEALADRAAIHRTHLSLIERGQRMPTLFVVQQLAKALGTTMVDLMRDVESGEPLGAEPAPLPRGRPRKKKRAARKAAK